VLNIGVLTVNDFSFHPNGRLREAAEKLGHKIILINPYDMIAGISKSTFEYYIDSIADNLDVVMPRQGSPMGDYGLVLLRQFNELDIPLVNNLNGITITRNQYITLQVLTASDLAVPDTCFITKKELLRNAVQQVGGFPVVLKQIDGMGGTGVIKVNSEKDAVAFLEHHLSQRRGVLVQQFLSPEKRQDVRVLVVGGKVAGAMELKPEKMNFRANIHQQGKAEKFDLSEELESLALKAANVCDLEIAGIDLILKKGCDPVIIEVNFSPGFKGLESACSIDVAEKVIHYVVSTHRAPGI